MILILAAMESLLQYKRDQRILDAGSAKHVKDITKYFRFVSLIATGVYGLVCKVEPQLDQTHFFSSIIYPGKFYALKISRTRNTREAVINALLATSAVPETNIARAYMWWRITTKDLDDQLPIEFKLAINFNTSGYKNFYLTLMELYDTTLSRISTIIHAADPPPDTLLFRKASAAQIAAGLHCIRSVIPDFFHMDLSGQNILGMRQDLALVYLLPGDVVLVVPTFLTDTCRLVIADMGEAVGSYLVDSERVAIGTYTPNTVPDLIEVLPELKTVLDIGNEWDCYLRVLGTAKYFDVFRCATADVEKKIKDLAGLFGDKLHNPTPLFVTLPTTVQTRTQKVDSKINFLYVFYISGTIDQFTFTKPLTSGVQFSELNNFQTRGNTKSTSCSCGFSSCESTAPRL